MKCEKCKGRGEYENPKFDRNKHYEHDRYLKCKNCKESGYICGNLADVKAVLESLTYYFSEINKDKERLQAVKDCIKVIENE